MPGADRFRLRLHPLFFGVGILSAFTGDFLIFLSSVLAGLEHELAHALAARRCGFTLDHITLMPYGAVVSGDLAGMGRAQAVFVLAAGPLASGVTALFFVALWWLFPECYPYTELAAMSSFTLFAVNLLPALPLDGGRLLYRLCKPLGRRRASVIVGMTGALTAVGILTVFVVSCFSKLNFSALIFFLLLVVGGAESLRGGREYRVLTFDRTKSFERGIEERRVAISCERTLSDALRFLGEEKYLVLILYRDGEYLGELTEEEFLAALKEEDYSRPLGDFLPSF